MLHASTAADIDLYFGVGCFWHIQHEIIQAERDILNRLDSELTALCGYAGGTGVNGFGGVCYPYYSTDGALKHAEVVGFRIPEEKLPEFATVYWSLFVGINRVDVQDVGPDYRAVLGFSGGIQNAEYTEIFRNAQGTQKFDLLEGQGGDADTLGVAQVWVMDSDDFPFFQAEAAHQFHDDMVEKYPQDYNDLREAFLMDCRLRPTPCRMDATFRSEWTEAQKLCPTLEITASGSSSDVSSDVSSGTSSSGDSGGGSGNWDAWDDDTDDSTDSGDSDSGTASGGSGGSLDLTASQESRGTEAGTSSTSASGGNATQPSTDEGSMASSARASTTCRDVATALSLFSAVGATFV